MLFNILFTHDDMQVGNTANIPIRQKSMIAPKKTVHIWMISPIVIKNVYVLILLLRIDIVNQFRPFLGKVCRMG